ncbi:MAG: glycosyltransferase [Thermoplasmata archaeon]|nr:glycosyltransferase [Thermoplasmata archaeon]TFG68134.1 MAG: glycosyltransferase family 1 protein [Methanomassiliicoccus sp.]
MVSVCMLTELESYKGIIPYKNPGGMGTNAPMVVRELEKLGCRVIMNKPEEDYDVLHIHSPLPNSFLWAIKRKISGKPLVVHGRHLPELIKGGFVGGSLFYPFVRMYSVLFYNMGDIVLGATPYVAKSLSRDGVRRPFRIIPNGINREVFVRDPERGASFRERWGVKPDERLVVSVGLRIPRKGVDTFVSMSSRMAHRPDVKFVWVGASEVLLKDALDETSTGRVSFVGHIPFEDIVGVYSAADVFVFPTKAESYGNVMLEAASCGCPLLIRDIPVYEEWVKDGIHCLKARTDEEFVSKLEQMLDDPALRASMVTGARSLAEEHDIKKCAKMLKAMYEEMAEGGIRADR